MNEVPYRVDDLTGRKFGRLRAREYLGNDKSGHARWRCTCACGNEVVVIATNLKTGNSKSCGCRKLEVTAMRAATHRMSHTKLYRVWRSMISRCTNPNVPAYDRYGGRGIAVCDRWHDFANFYADMGDPPSPQHTLERIDNDGDYSPDNCRWATRTHQARNRASNHRITFRGKTRTLAGWAEETGINRSTILDRLHRGWSVERALTTPPRKMRRQ